MQVSYQWFPCWLYPSMLNLVSHLVYSQLFGLLYTIKLSPRDPWPSLGSTTLQSIYSWYLPLLSILTSYSSLYSSQLTLHFSGFQILYYHRLLLMKKTTTENTSLWTVLKSEILEYKLFRLGPRMQGYQLNLYTLRLKYISESRRWYLSLQSIFLTSYKWLFTIDSFHM